MPEIATIKRADYVAQNRTVYWVELRKPSGDVVRSIATDTMTDAVILRDRLVDFVESWVEAL